MCLKEKGKGFTMISFLKEMLKEKGEEKKISFPFGLRKMFKFNF